MNATLPTWDVLQTVMPEITMVLGMCAVLLAPFVKRESRTLSAWTAAGALVLALLATVMTLPATQQTVFGGMLAIDPFSQFMKALLIVFTLLVVGQWSFGSKHDTHAYDVPDFMCLLLGAAFGMMLMVSATNLLMIFMAMESASFPSYALAGFRKQHRFGAEGAVKYVVFGAASSAVMLYGMSLIYGVTGSLSFAAVAQSAAGGISPMLGIGLLAMFVGVAFKLSAVPMHFWCPDVFEAAPIEVTTFLSVASKGAAVALLLRLAQAFGDMTFLLGAQPLASVATGLALAGAVTATWGNLVAFHQNNIKRLLAYSSIAHAGYMIMAAAMLVIAEPGPAARTMTGAIMFYLVVYLFMNLGAFTAAGVIARQADTARGEDIRSYAGLARRSPLITVMMAAFLLSLFGMPGLGGFMGKIYLAAGMLGAGQWAGYLLIAVLLINTLLSLYLYLRPVYYMVLVGSGDGHAVEEAQPPIYVGRLAGALMAMCLVGVLWTGILPGMAGGLARDFAVMKTAEVTAAPRTADPAAPIVPLAQK